MSTRDFCPTAFGANIETAIVGGLAAAVLSSRATAQARADARETDDAFISWVTLVEDLQARIRRLSVDNSRVTAALDERDDQLSLAHATIATLRHRLAKAGR